MKLTKMLLVTLLALACQGLAQSDKAARGKYLVEELAKVVDEESRQRGATMQQISEIHKDLLRNLIDQQLWLSKGQHQENCSQRWRARKLPN